MEDISLYSVKQGSQQELTLILLYVYNICGDIDDYKDLGALQNLFMALVRAFRKEAHLRKVMEAIIEKHKTHKLLTVKNCCSEEEAGEPLHPFEYPRTIKENFLEDPVIFHRAQGNIGGNLPGIVCGCGAAHFGIWRYRIYRWPLRRI